jgi:hypothetical protein
MSRKAHHSPENHDEIYSGHHSLIGAVFDANMGKTNTWAMQCVDTSTDDATGKRTHKKISYRKLKLPWAVFTSPEWVLTECGRWWCDLAGLRQDYVYHHAGGKPGPVTTIKCTHT